ncbi:CheR family methyltransferase [Flavobacterium sp. FBOR7N2.3]|uniref:protein-glutamate O-methyltransferase n=1 Tax=Flavobacterium magnesitis TaxID=3138077 RepID=A0ABV4TJ11_9FLAO
MQNKTSNFPVVGIGVSTEGMDGLKKIVSDIPNNSGMAYIIIQHFMSNVSSNLSEILAPHAKIPVHEIINEINLEPNQIYIMPENNVLTTMDGVLKLKWSTRNEKRYHNDIDVFFESLSKVYKSSLIGIMLLSDSGFDGARGFKKIKEAGGVTILQDPKKTVFKRIPQIAIDSYVSDYIMTPENIPSELLQIQKKYTSNYGYNDEENIPIKQKEIFNQIINLIFLRTGNDFSNYKQSTIRRRIAIRMVIIQKDTLESYYSFLQNNTTEQDILFNDFLITVTYFFRDQEYFESLNQIVFPSLLQNSTNNTLRIWVAGCATGEEAYSLAISIHDYLLETNNTHIKVQIFASDLSKKSIIKARSAIYSHQDVQHIAEERLQNYFVKTNGHYHVNRVIRDMCIFAVHNFVKNPPFARIDLVSCRNVLMYFNPFLQNKALASFHYSLQEKGILFLGKSETVSHAQNLFENIGGSTKIYIRKLGSDHNQLKANPSATNNLLKKNEATPLKTVQKKDFQKIVSDVLFSKYTPVSVIINENLDIVHFHGDTSPFLSPSSGKPSFNILKMIDENISLELHNAIFKVKKEKINIRKDNIPVKNQPYLISFEIILLENDDEHLMILFYKVPLENVTKAKSIQKKQNPKLIDEPEEDLSQIQENSKKTDVEELQTINEESESTAQELESIQEELVHLNDELKESQKQLTKNINFSESIIKTIHEPLLIIDRYFFIKSANPAFYKYFNTTDTETEGYLLFDIENAQWNISEFKEQISKVIHEDEIIENFKMEMICANVGKKTMLVNARQIQNSNNELVLLTLNDSTDLVNVNQLLTLKKMKMKKHNNQLELFTSAASHDLHEFLNKIQMFSQRIVESEKNISESGQHDLERIQCLTASMNQLLNDVVNYSKANFLERKYVKTDLNSILKKSIKDLKDIITEKNAEIVVADFPVLKAIPHQIQQLFTNLITNSIKYSKPGVIPKIKIESKKYSTKEILEIGGNPEIHYIKIGVIDNGIGFEKGYETKIFEPFYRLHADKGYKGSGLGLTLAKKIVSNHRGFIKSISEKNHGTTMIIYIPLQMG